MQYPGDAGKRPAEASLTAGKDRHPCPHTGSALPPQRPGSNPGAGPMEPTDRRCADARCRCHAGPMQAWAVHGPTEAQQALIDELAASEQITFPPPGALLSMNDRLHWRAERNRQRGWQAAAKIYALEQLPRPVRRDPSVVRITLPVVDNRRRDPHNYFATVKPIVDGLVHAGVWPDDTPEFVTTVEPTLRVYTRAEMHRRRVTITITPRAGGAS